MAPNKTHIKETLSGYINGNSRKIIVSGPTPRYSFLVSFKRPVNKTPNSLNTSGLVEVLESENTRYTRGNAVSYNFVDSYLYSAKLVESSIKMHKSPISLSFLRENQKNFVILDIVESDKGKNTKQKTENFALEFLNRAVEYLETSSSYSSYKPRKK